MWGVGILALCLFGLVLVNLFGDITVTNQQDYTLMKNTVEASINDAVDIAAYRYGFCLCTSKSKTMDVDGNLKWSFSDVSQYSIYDLKNDSCDYVKTLKCEKMLGETKIRKEVFAESLIRRFGENSKNTKNYEIIIQEVIEYPPKVSVMIKSGNTFNIFQSDEDEFNIVNSIDSILEEK